MSAKPVTKPRWALTGAGADATNVTTPSSGEQDTGYTGNQIPTSGKLNWLFNWIAKWVNFLDDSPAFVPTTTNAAGLGATGNGTGTGLQGTGGPTGGFGISGLGGGSTTTAGKGGSFAGGGGVTNGNGGDGVLGTGGAGAGAGAGGTGVVGQGTGAGKGGSFTGGASAGIGVSALGGNAATTAGRGGEFTGGAGTTNGNGGDGLIGTGGPSAGSGVGGAGVVAVAGSGNTRGALNLAIQTAPTSPSNGDLWATTGALFARIAGVTQQLLATTQAALGSLEFIGNPGNTASTVYFAWGGTSQAAVAANGTASAIGQTTHMAVAAGVLRSLIVKTGQTTVGGSVDVKVLVNGANLGLQINIPAGSAAGVFSVTGTITVAAGDRVEISITNNAGVTTSLGLSMIAVSVAAA